MGWQVRLLGGFEVSRAGDGPVRIPTRKARALLAVLARRAGELQSRESLAALLWPDSGEGRARESLRQTLKLLRRALAGLAAAEIVADRDTLALRAPEAAVDVVAFEHRCREAEPEALERAVELYRGALLDGFVPPTESFEDWLRQERTALHERAVDALVRLVADAANGGESAVRGALRLLAADPLDERLHRLLMRVYLGQGRPNAALAQLEQAREILRRELGVEPEPETVELGRRIRERRAPAAAGPASDPLRERPAVAVLPLRNLSEDPEQDYFADGLTEDIISGLSRWRAFPVIGGGSSFAFETGAVDVRRAGAELGARYVLEGSVRRSGRRVRIGAQLVDGERGHHLWTERYDRELDDVFEVQDDIALRIAAVVVPELTRAELQRSMAKRPGDLDAWDYYLRGRARIRERTCSGNRAARALFEKALALQPDYVDAHAGLARSHNFDILLDCVADRPGTARAALAAARRAVACDESSAIAHQEVSTAYQWLERHDEALAEVRVAVALNPYDAVGLHQLGNKSDLAGDPHGIACMEKAHQLSPLDTQVPTRLAFLARAHLNAGNDEAAVRWARRAIERRPDLPAPRYVLALALGRLGCLHEGRAALATCDELKPGFVEGRKSWKPYVDPASNERLREALRLLGLD